ncbi:CPBP family intramembrane glutamic endopeptidase [Streptomyces sp. NPDC126514]|uniref:CPBP family intramembrane glutamic endopeptidase n=1 Tax=Streptomyces sp. NPDC126514 TaxID=3155210 RepID=UPI00331E9AB7
MTTAPLLTALPFHRMACYTGRHRWWRPVAGSLLVFAGWLLIVGFADAVISGVGEGLGRPSLPDGTTDFGALGNIALQLLYIALLLPLVLLAVRWTGRRPAGTVSSVTGRLRWRWLGRCLAAALPAAALLGAAVVFLPIEESVAGAEPAQWVGWPMFLTSLPVLALVVPLQAAAEEYVFRGWLLQAVGGFLRSPWCAVLPQALLFGAAHGWGTVWGFVDLCVFGAVAGYLTVRTGGLEAAVALHVVNNLLAFGLSAAVVDGLVADETSADAPWLLAVVDMTVVLLYAATVHWLARLHRPQRISTSAPRPVMAAPAAPPPPSGPTPPYAAGPAPGHGRQY